jgi:two-component system, cell cycle response regulator DivK
LKILYVEDNEDNIYVLENRLKRYGYTVLVARDGATGVELAQLEQPDLILMDLSLPVLDGWEATRQIKGSDHTRRIPVIALTSNAMTGDREKALAAGCDDFDTKPIVMSRLLEKIRAASVSVAGDTQDEQDPSHRR